MLLLKLPIPLPSLECKSSIVGLGIVLQHMPRAVIAVPPLEVTLPPQVAALAVMSLTTLVVTVGATGFTTTLTLAVPVQP